MSVNPNTVDALPFLGMVEASIERLRKFLLPIELAEAELKRRPAAAVMVILREGPDGLEVLLGERKKREGDPWSGQVGLPGGRHHAEDGTLLSTAIRETREEVGLELDRSSLRELGTVRTQAHGEPEGREVHMRLWSARPTDAGAEPSPSGEIGALHWVTSADAHRCPPAGVETLRVAVELGLVD